MCPISRSRLSRSCTMSSNLLDEGIRVAHLRVGSRQPRIQALAGAEPDQQLLEVASLRGVASMCSSRVIGIDVARRTAPVRTDVRAPESAARLAGRSTSRAHRRRRRRTRQRRHGCLADPCSACSRTAGWPTPSIRSVSRRFPSSGVRLRSTRVSARPCRRSRPVLLIKDVVEEERGVEAAFVGQPRLRGSD